MKILTYQAPSPKDAMKMVQAELGDEAVIIETKEIQKKALGRTPLYELVVGIDEESYKRSAFKKESQRDEKSKEQRRERQRSSGLSAQELSSKSSDVFNNISEAAKQISKIADVTEELPYENDSSVHKKREKREKRPAAMDDINYKEIKKDIEKLGDKVKIIQNMFWDEKSPEIDTPIPPEYSEIYKLSLQSGMDKKHLDEIMHLTLQHMPLKMRENSTTVKRYFQTVLRKLIPIRKESTPTLTQKKVIMLVGPTGVGKTTSIAKLAARYSYLLDKKYKVGLIVLDTYRIGAVEQLMQYARMMKLAIETVVDPPEFTSALQSMEYCDYILIDTMGSSPNDQDKIGQIYQCLNSNDTQYNIDVILVLPSSIKYDDMLLTYENFSSLGVDTMMFTKLDETRGFGNIFSFTYETKKPISYFSVGQEVPEDLSVASSDFLIDCMLHGFNRSKA